jgi:hypothetical protein
VKTFLAFFWADTKGKDVKPAGILPIKAENHTHAMKKAKKFLPNLEKLFQVHCGVEIGTPKKFYNPSMDKKLIDSIIDEFTPIFTALKFANITICGKQKRSFQRK